eukprot:scaffold4995_cov385-Prasinococcus_capsulatus_cf.AAC.2
MWQDGTLTCGGTVRERHVTAGPQRLCSAPDDCRPGRTTYLEAHPARRDRQLRAPLELASKFGVTPQLVAPPAMPLVASPAEPVAPVPSMAKAIASAASPMVAGQPFGKIELNSPKYYAASLFGGVLACGLTHLAVTPLDVVKCNMQTDPVKYPSIPSAFGTIAREGGASALLKGWLPTLIGYSAQGACKFGFYEFFKKYYSDLVGEENAKKYKDFIYLGGSASAEFFADIALCPFEAVKVRVQTQPGFAEGWSDGFPKLVAQDGYAGLFRGLVPLWARQIPYTMMKFGCFERTVEAIYTYGMPKPKSECSKQEQLGVSFLAGYIAGVFCAVVSHPADNLVSKMNQRAGVPASEIIAEMGLYNLFTRGLPLRIVMIGTLTGLQWGIYDAFKVFVGLPTTGATPAPEKK